MHWEKYLELTFDSKGDLYWIKDKVHIWMPMPMPMLMTSFPNGQFQLIDSLVLCQSTQSNCIALWLHSVPILVPLVSKGWYRLRKFGIICNSHYGKQKSS